MTEDNCRIGDEKVMTNSKGAPSIVKVIEEICRKKFFPMFVQDFLNISCHCLLIAIMTLKLKGSQRFSAV